MQSAAGGFERIAAGDPGLVAIGVELHLPEHEAGDNVADVHQHPEDFSRQPNTSASDVNHPANANIQVVGGRFEPFVPGVALIDDTHEPKVDGADDVGQPHAGALAE